MPAYENGPALGRRLRTLAARVDLTVAVNDRLRRRGVARRRNTPGGAWAMSSPRPGPQSMIGIERLGHRRCTLAAERHDVAVGCSVNDLA